MTNRVVVTGMGVISAIGAGIEEFEKSLFEGGTGVSHLPLPGSEGDTPCAVYGVQDFVPQNWLGKKGIRVLDRSARLLCVAAQMALTEAGLSRLEQPEINGELGLICGTMFGSVHSITDFDWSGVVDGPKYVNPMAFPNTVINSPAGQAAIKHRLGGVNSTISAGMASGLYAIHYATEFLSLGRASTLLVGGVEELCQESYLGFQKNDLISPRGTLKPFASDRDGTVLGEASAIWTLETEQMASQEGRTPWLEVAGFGAAHDAYRIDAYQVRAGGGERAMRSALSAAGIEAEQIAVVVASGNGSPAGDRMESLALISVFGDALEGLPVCAPKAAYGEVLGASGALAAAVAGLALRRGEAPPTVGFVQTDQPLALSSKAQPLEGDYALVTALGCDGNNAAVVLKRWSEN